MWGITALIATVGDEFYNRAILNGLAQYELSSQKKKRGCTFINNMIPHFVFCVIFYNYIKVSSFFVEAIEISAVKRWTHLIFFVFLGQGAIVFVFSRIPQTICLRGNYV